MPTTVRKPGADGQRHADAPPARDSGCAGVAGRGGAASLLIVLALGFALVMPGLQEREDERPNEHANQHDLHRAQANATVPVHTADSNPLPGPIGPPGCSALSIHHPQGDMPIVYDLDTG